MDLRYYFSILLRRWKTIILILFLVLMGTGVTIWSLNNPQKSALIFISIGNERKKDVEADNYNPREAVEAADRFADTIQGWTKNPDLLRKIESKLGNSISLSARKQELQNLVLDLNMAMDIDAVKAANIVLLVMADEIENYNKATNSTFKIATKSINTGVNYPNNKIKFFSALLFGVILGILIVYLDEYLRGVVSFVPQAEEILEVKSFGTIKKHDESGLSLLAGYINGFSHKIVLAGVGIKSASLAVAIARNMARFSDKDTALLDFDFKERKLHQEVNITEEDPLGVTDLSEKRYSFISEYFRPVLEEGIKFLPAGRGKSFSHGFLDVVSRIMPKIIIHSTLPQNPEVLFLKDVDLVLLIKLGKTKMDDLRSIKAIFKGNIRFLVVK